MSKSSVSLWVRDIALSEAALTRLHAHVSRSTLVAGERKAARAREVRRGYQLEGRLRARQGDPAYIAGRMLYWAEGAKSRNTLEIVNSDPELLVSFAAFLRTYFDVTNDKMRLRCNLFADDDETQRRIEDFWLDRLELDRTKLWRSAVNVYSKYSLKKRRGKLPYGTCTLRVDSTRIVQTIYGSIQEYGGFDRPAWLD